jgi:HAD superfamily hydrolase (TIGR01549 family)
MRVCAFVPLKLKSRRLPNKNFLRLGDRPLAYHIFRTLSSIPDVDSVLCYTSQPQVLSLLPDDVELLMRPAHLDGDAVKANELFRYAVEHIDADVLVLCHATGPFVRPENIKRGIDAVTSGQHDCAFAVLRHQTYSWYQNKPLNYEPARIAQTQELHPVYTETSGFYIFRKDDYLTSGSRIGHNPCFVEVDMKESIDIDEPSDFSLASYLLDYDPSAHRYSTDTFFVDLANQNIPLKNIAHVAFDLDGVLIDSLALMEKAWAQASQAAGISIPFDRYKAQIGKPFFDILHNIGVPEDRRAEVARAYDEFSQQNEREIVVYPNAAGCLDRLRGAGIRVSVVTSKNRQRTDSILDHCFPQASFDAVVCPEDVPSGRGKPNPDPLLYACLQLGVDPYNTLYVGDMKADWEASRRASTHFVYANWGYGDLGKVRDVWFNTLDDLVAYILED